MGHAHDHDFYYFMKEKKKGFVPKILPVIGSTVLLVRASISNNIKYIFLYFREKNHKNMFAID